MQAADHYPLGPRLDFTDALRIDDASVRKTRDGYLVADARTARTGVQTYTAREMGLTDRTPSDVIRVYRPPEAVFDTDAMASLAWRPMTNDHPSEDVTADNWRRLSVGQSGGDVVRDGDFVRVPLVMMDASAIRDFADGKRQLSVGYTCDIELRDGTTPQGEAYDAVQSNIRANHIALCENARGGHKLSFGDDAPKPGDPPVNTKTIIVDGLQVETTDAGEAAIRKLQGQIADAATAKATLDAEVARLKTEVSTKDGEIAALNKKAEDAAVTPEMLDALVAERTLVIDAAKRIAGEKLGDTAGKTVAAIRRAAVAVKLPDALDATKMDDAAVSGAFRALTPTTDQSADGVRNVMMDGGGSGGGGGSGDLTAARKRADDARAKMIDHVQGVPEPKAA